MQMVKLYPEGSAEARFKISGVKKIFFYCNRSGLFSLNVVKGIDDWDGGYDNIQERKELEVEKRPMYVFLLDGKIVGYYSLALLSKKEIELNNLSVLPEYRHNKIGTKLLQDCFERARKLEAEKIKIGIVEENAVLRSWYERYGFYHTGTQKFDFFPFICGYMEKKI